MAFICARTVFRLRRCSPAASFRLFSRVGFIVTNLRRRAEGVVHFYNQRVAAERWIKGGEGAIRWTRLSCQRFKDSALRLRLLALACNLANFLRTLALPHEVSHWPPTTLREKLVKTCGERSRTIGAKAVRHGRHLAFQLAEVAVPGVLFERILASSERSGRRAIPSEGG
jgi:hypothetical protein